MSSVGLRVSNVTVDKAVRIAQSKILSQIPTPIANEVYTDSFISFNNMNPVTKELIITGDNGLSMAKSGLLIVDYQPNIGNYPYTLLFNLGNTPSDVNGVAFAFNLSNQTPSRLIRVIRSGIAPLTVEKPTILGTTEDVYTGINYIYFQVNGVGESTKTPVFYTIADWSFVVSLKFDTIEGQTYNRICFNVLL